LRRRGKKSFFGAKMAATFSIESVLKRELPQLGVPASTVAFLAGISSGTLSKYLNGSANAPVEHELRLRNALSALKRLIERARPLPLDYRKVEAIRESLEMVETGRLAIIVYETDSATETPQQQ
jgi:transcriptional regulator with XRE-family HTH domain